MGKLGRLEDVTLRGHQKKKNEEHLLKETGRSYYAGGELKELETERELTILGEKKGSLSSKL